MGHLVLDKQLPMTKVVISFWFRVPKETAEIAYARASSDLFWDFRIFLDVVPLLVFGRQPMGNVYDTNVIILGYYYGYDLAGNPSYEFPVSGTEVSGPRLVPMQPTTIGVRVSSNGDLSGALNVHIQTADKGSATNTKSINSGWTPVLNEDGVAIGIDERTFSDVSYATCSAPEYLGNSDAVSVSSGAARPEITFDEWHHLLLSWDLGTNSTQGTHDPHANPIDFVDSYSMMWCAIDDVNKKGPDLPALTVASLNSPYEGEGNPNFNPNAMLCYSVHHYAGNLSGPDAPLSSFIVAFSGDVGHSVIIPSGVSYAASAGPPDADYAGQTSPVKPLERIELAELQIFTGITLDTDVEANRRAFIDFERDDEGRIIKDKDGKATLLPVDPKIAQELLRKKPDILLHGTSDWQNGKNSGSLGVDDDGTLIPSGQFKRTGTINPYTPDPSLNKSTSTSRKAGPPRLTKKPAANARL